MGTKEKIKSFFFIRPKIKVLMLDESGRLRTFLTKYDNNQFEKWGGLYNVRHDMMVYHKNDGMMPTCLYSMNNPEPHLWHHMRNPALTAEGFKKVLEDDVVEQLFSTNLDSLLKTIFLVLCVVGLLCLAMALVVFKIVKL